MKHKKKYITLASMLVLGGLVTTSQFEDTRENKAETNSSPTIVTEKSDTLEENESTLEDFGLYTNSGVIWVSSVKEAGGVTVYDYMVGDNFTGAIQLTNATRPKFKSNMFYTLTKTDLEGKNKEVLVDNEKYTENQVIQTAGKGEGIYNLAVQMRNVNDKDEIVIVTAEIYELDDLSFDLIMDAKDPKKATIESKHNIESITYNLIKYGGIAEESIDGGEIIKTDTINSKKIPDTLFMGLEKGSYALEVEAFGKEYSLNDAGVQEKVSSTETVKFEVTKNEPLAPKVTVTLDTIFNPLDIVGSPSIEDSELSWKISDTATNKEVASDKTTRVPVSKLKELPAGDYTVLFTETATDGTKATDSTPFQIKKPSIKLDLKDTNPDVIMAKTSGIIENTVEWEISNEDTIVSIGDTNFVTNSLLNDLEKGNYKITFRETDVYDNVAEQTAEFKVTDKGNAGVIDEDTTIIDGGTGEVIGGGNTNDGTKPDEDTPVTTPDEDTPEGENGESNGGETESTKPDGNIVDGGKGSDTETTPNGTNGEGTESNSKFKVAKFISEEKPALKDVEINALKWGKQVEKTVMASDLRDFYGYANIPQDSPLYLKDWDAPDKDGNYGVAAQDTEADPKDPIEYSDGTWRNNNIIEDIEFGKNLDELVARYLASDEGKAYAETPEGSKSVENYAKTLKQTDKSSVMVSLGFLLTAIGLGFVLTYFLDKRKKGKVVAEKETSDTPVTEESKGYTVEEVDLKKDVEKTDSETPDEK